MSTTPQLVELVDDGPTQTVRIPAEFHLDARAVQIRRNDVTGELILAPAPRESRSGTWAAFFDRINQSEPEPLFMQDRPMNRIVAGNL